MSREFHHVDNLLGCHGPPIFAGLLDVRREPVLVGLVARLVVKTDDGGMEVEIGLDGHRIAYVLGESELLRQEHESAGQAGIDLTMPIPKLAVLEVLGAILGLLVMDVLKDLVEVVAHYHGRGEGRIGRPGEDVGNCWRLFLSSLAEGLFRAGETRGQLARRRVSLFLATDPTTDSLLVCG